MLPVNATDDYGSPYQGTSVHAGNSSFICLQDLINKGWLGSGTLADHRDSPIMSSIAAARAGFTRLASEADQNHYQSFRKQHTYWLGDYALYAVIKAQQHHLPWWEWPDELRRRDPAALDSCRESCHSQYEDYCFEQYIFFRQWQELRRQAQQYNILLLGDMPIFIAHDSVDVWAHQECFQLDDKGLPVVVAGVPPDYFSATGQRWGNPLYNWKCMQDNGFQWWLRRLRTQMELFDLVRLDHFRGFVSTWTIPAHCETAIDGSWIKVPGQALFEVIRQEYRELPFIAEDLGTITKEVLQLRDAFNLPGMKVLLFAFDSDAHNPYLPHNHEPNSVVYTGTHDNNTSLGWFYNLDDSSRQKVMEYLQFPRDAMPWPLIHAALQSVCHTCIIPMQDLLGLDGSHRMNTPGTTAGNWRWRFDWEWASSDLVGKLARLNKLYGRS